MNEQHTSGVLCIFELLRLDTYTRVSISTIQPELIPTLGQNIDICVSSGQTLKCKVKEVIPFVLQNIGNTKFKDKICYGYTIRCESISLRQAHCRNQAKTLSHMVKRESVIRPLILNILSSIENELCKIEDTKLLDLKNSSVEKLWSDVYNAFETLEETQLVVGKLKLKELSTGESKKIIDYIHSLIIQLVLFYKGIKNQQLKPFKF